MLFLFSSLLRPWATCWFIWSGMDTRDPQEAELSLPKLHIHTQTHTHTELTHWALPLSSSNKILDWRNSGTVIRHVVGAVW